ncbi:MAG: UDP-N-acetylglucosamine--N-acetylmuramyl-(pentapeptide) pyrophosphoryl-undecaprenol N-acetylglucosamine transferase, partial [Alphaproteobacteria bacterium]|nr:UDP-N-acetylglucosamine--N-acetylmuramyl-(pentapeptide) pyrophosphoryl-undecaprenol N-acetylglucosamine transferase [Alphaproteobacteria bacterium]
ANASALAAAGGAEVHMQSSLSAEKLSERLSALMREPRQLATMAAAARSTGKPDAVQLLADLTEAIASGKTVLEFRKEMPR